MKASVYVSVKKQKDCLLETNVINPLGLMLPPTEVEPMETDHNQSSHVTVRLVQTQKIPTQKGVYLEAQPCICSATIHAEEDPDVIGLNQNGRLHL